MGLFWIWDENIPDSTPVFPLLQSSAYLNKKGCPASHTALPGRRLGVPGKLGGGTARTVGPGWPTGWIFTFAWLHHWPSQTKPGAQIICSIDPLFFLSKSQKVFITTERQVKLACLLVENAKERAATSTSQLEKWTRSVSIKTLFCNLAGKRLP